VAGSGARQSRAQDVLFFAFSPTSRAPLTPWYPVAPSVSSQRSRALLSRTPRDVKRHAAPTPRAQPCRARRNEGRQFQSMPGSPPAEARDTPGQRPAAAATYSETVEEDSTRHAVVAPLVAQCAQQAVHGEGTAARMEKPPCRARSVKQQSVPSRGLLKRHAQEEEKSATECEHAAQQDRQRTTGQKSVPVPKRPAR